MITFAERTAAWDAWKAAQAPMWDECEDIRIRAITEFDRTYKLAYEEYRKKVKPFWDTYLKTVGPDE